MNLLEEMRRERREKFKVFNQAIIDSKALVGNIELLKKVAGMQVIPVLKSNAYGHGIKETADILEKAGAKIVAVDSYFEARQIYKIFSGKIVVLGVIKRENIGRLKGKRISYVLQGLEDLKEFGERWRKANVHLELNTGMNRLGILPEEVDEYLKTLKKYKKLHLEGVMTHLSAADEIMNNSAEAQVQKFDMAVGKILADGFRPEFIHVANSAGTGRVRSRYANAVRAGIGTYGVNPLEKGDERFEEFERLQPILELKSTIVKVMDLAPGEKVGYGGSFVVQQQMCVAVLPIGYYEGIPRELSNKGVVSFDGQELPIVGKVCMNHMMIDVSGTALKTGDEVTVISRDKWMKNSVIGMQMNFGLFAYETLARLNQNIRKVIK